MNVPVPVLIAIGVAVLVLLVLALRRRGGDRDLISPPRMGAGPPPAAPAGALPRGELPPELLAEVRALLAQGNKIEAIKIVRIATRLGLGEAKELVERL